MTSLFELVCNYVDGEMSVIPIRTDGTKSPIWEWDEFKKRKPTCKELHRWFYKSELGIGIVGGIVSRGLEIIDFDCAELYEPWRRSIGEALAQKLTVVKTPGGWHVYYRCCEVGRNRKIAVDPTKEKTTLIETRGDGGYVLAPGSPPNCHPTGREYIYHSGPPLPKLSIISPIERKLLFEKAFAFDKRSVGDIQTLKAKANGWDTRKAASNEDIPAPIRWVNETLSWVEILQPYGWTSHDGEYWTRPGKRYGTSARVMPSKDGTEVLVVFSSNAGPIAANGEPRKLNKYEALRWLKYAGNGRQAFLEIKEAMSK